MAEGSREVISINIDYFEELWNAQENPYERYKKTNPEAWNNRVDEFISERPDERLDNIRTLLVEKEMLNETSVVLDLGCGPGKFVLDFARTAQKAVGVDISPQMLQAAEESRKASGITNAEFVVLDWRTADVPALQWQKKFSLVTSIMSPAVSNRKSLENMIQASHGYGLLCNFMDRSNSVGDELKRIILGRKSNHDFGNRGLYCSFNILWLLGLFPEIVYFETERQVTRPLEEAVRYYRKKLEQKKPLTQADQEKMEAYLTEKAVSGIVTEQVKAKVGCVYWKNP